MSTTQIILLALGAVLLFWVVGAYNRMVRMRNEIGNAFAQIDVQLKRRHDLIPNLVEVARKYLEHERETLERVTAARARSSASSAPTDRGVSSSAPTDPAASRRRSSSVTDDGSAMITSRRTSGA